MPDYSWRDAIMKVLEGSSESMHYAEIAEAIAEQGLRTDFGATPAASVNSIISTSINNEVIDSPFVRVGRGRYSLRKRVDSPLVEQV